MQVQVNLGWNVVADLPVLSVLIWEINLIVLLIVVVIKIIVAIDAVLLWQQCHQKELQNVVQVVKQCYYIQCINKFCKPASWIRIKQVFSSFDREQLTFTAACWAMLNKLCL